MDNLPEIPGYKLIGILGEGGISKVYLGLQNDTDRNVAVKIVEALNPRNPRKQALTERFLREVETVTALSHPNIVEILGSGKLNDRYYLVMEYLEKSLKEKMKELQESATRFEQVGLEIIKQIAGALHFAHEKGIIHRDIKPANIMFRSDGTAVLTDFGLAKLVHAAQRLTQTGITVGTPDYMSPEQIEGNELDGRADLYSLGVILYEILTGEVPYKAGNYVALAMKHLKKKVPKLPRHVRQYQPLLDRMMAKNRDQRVADANTLIELIDMMQQANKANN